jgi:hypothetical protein
VGSSQTKTQKSDDKSWIFILLLLIGMALVFFSGNSDQPNKVKNQNQYVNDPDHMRRVDEHLKDTAFNVEADRQQRQIEAYQQLSKLHNSQAQTPYQENKEFSLESDPHMQELTRDLDRSQERRADQYTPEEIVQQKLYEDQQFQRASQAYREAYAQQFKENARKGGWDIELGPNYEVLSVKKIKENRAPSLFHDGNGGSSR